MNAHNYAKFVADTSSIPDYVTTKPIYDDYTRNAELQAFSAYCTIIGLWNQIQELRNNQWPDKDEQDTLADLEGQLNSYPLGVSYGSAFTNAFDGNGRLKPSTCKVLFCTGGPTAWVEFTFDPDTGEVEGFTLYFQCSGEAMEARVTKLYDIDKEGWLEGQKEDRQAFKDALYDLAVAPLGL